ncbi:hypothetical protein L0222_19635 [bacterium]|nr:hypothetical protein [bacterium]MCI0602730.1 hypothetical protein [bacterium]
MLHKLLVLCLTAFSISPVSADSPVDAASARSAFELYKTLDGKWIGKSTKGWKEEVTFRIIAGGSVVTETSFDAHPNETMLTTVLLDNDRLLLTHYCVAGNQPRLQLTSYDRESKTLVFTFLDATNLPSRDKGHMDKVVIHFLDRDHVTSQWTWYQDGNERWLEKINLERKE